MCVCVCACRSKDWTGEYTTDYQDILPGEIYPLTGSPSQKEQAIAVYMHVTEAIIVM